MPIYYLYVKTHVKTGLKYLGYTNQNPYKYKGSGKYWKLHLKKHGYDIITEILYESENKKDIKEKGIYYSKLWNIVESEEWANLKEESGDGGQSLPTKKLIENSKILWEKEEHRQKMSKIHNSIDFKTKMSKISKEWCNSPEGKIKKSESRKKLWNDDSDYKEKMNKLFKNEEYRKKLSNSAKKARRNIEFLRQKAINERKNDPIIHCEFCDINVKGLHGWGRHVKSKKHKQFICD